MILSNTKLAYTATVKHTFGKTCFRVSAAKFVKNTALVSLFTTLFALPAHSQSTHNAQIKLQPSIQFIATSLVGVTTISPSERSSYLITQSLDQPKRIFKISASQPLLRIPLLPTDSESLASNNKFSFFMWLTQLHDKIHSFLNRVNVQDTPPQDNKKKAQKANDCSQTISSL